MAEEIEVSPEMIEAGQAAYGALGDYAPEILTAIYRAMEAKRREQASKDGRNG